MATTKGKKYTVNQKIYEAKNAAGVSHWQIADELGICEMTLQRKLRHQLQPDQEAEVLEAIRKAESKNKGRTIGGTNND